MSILANINSLSDDIKTMQMLLDEHGISYKNDIGHPLDDVTIISDYIDELEIENQRIELLEENIEDLHRDLILMLTPRPKIAILNTWERYQNKLTKCIK